MPETRTIRGTVANHPFEGTKRDGLTRGLCFRLYEYSNDKTLTHYVTVFLAYPSDYFGPPPAVSMDQVVACEGRYVEVRDKGGRVQRFLEGPLKGLSGKGIHIFQEELPMDMAAGAAP